jgi:L-asparaginase
VLSTGGAIASNLNPLKTGYEAVPTGEDLFAAVPTIRKVAHAQVEQISNISGSGMNPEFWMVLARRVNDLLTMHLIECALCMLRVDEIRS